MSRLFRSLKSTVLAAKGKKDTGNEEDLKDKFEALETSKWEVDYSHISIEVQELNELMEVNDDYSALKLLDVFDELDITDDDLNLWKGYNDSGTVFSSKQYARNRLKTVLDYSEENKKASTHAKNQLRVVTKLLLEDPNHERFAPAGILLLLAAHGNVCNVQKEVGIACAFGMMTNSLKEFVDGQSFSMTVYRLLRDFRYLCVEDLYKTFKATNNIHSIALVTNEIATKIGVTPIADPQATGMGLKSGWKNNLSEKFFEGFYNYDRIVQYVQAMIKEKKIAFPKIVDFVKAHKPSKYCANEVTQYELLEAAIDVNTGEIRLPYLCWILEELKIFKPYTGERPAEWGPEI